jgi:hypothetical protein
MAREPQAMEAFGPGHVLRQQILIALLPEQKMTA